MKRTTIILPDGLKIHAIKKAREIGISLGELIRQSLHATLKNTHAHLKNDPFLNDERLFTKTAPTDGAKNHDDYLYGEN